MNVTFTKAAVELVRAKGGVVAPLRCDQITFDGVSVKLQGTMNMNSEGDIILQSSEDEGKGSCTPPDFETDDQSSTSAGGDFRISEDANIN